jgi:protein-tyrosine phosphatase
VALASQSSADGRFTIRPVTGSDRHITFQAAFNCRDLGGYKADDGRIVRWGAVYRSGSLHRLTIADLESANRIGFRTVIDLRSSAELERSGWFRGIDVAFHHAPLFEEDSLPFKWADPDDPEPPLGEDYVAIAENGARALATALRVIAECEHPVVFHCAAGKDRTGILAGLLLSALGISDETIMEDYELTNRSLPDHLSWAKLNDPEEAAEISARPTWLLRSSGSVIKAFLEKCRTRHGSIEAYLQGLGVKDETLDALRVRLLEG